MVSGPRFSRKYSSPMPTRPVTRFARSLRVRTLETL